MKPVSAIHATLLCVAISLAVVGCGNDDNDMSQRDIQYLSHLDQSRFLQRQGELKASTLEARNAIELQPNTPAPYFVIINNLLKAGDAINALRQLGWLMESIPEDTLDVEDQNRANLIRAEARLLRGHTSKALDALANIASEDDTTQIEKSLLQGRILLTANQVADAKERYSEARALDPESALPLVGLSRVAIANGEEERARELIAEAEQIDPENPELWLWKAQMAHNNENWPTAEEAYVRALEDIGQYDIMTFRKYETISALIRVLRAQGKSAEAFVYEEILAKSGPGTIKSNITAAREAYEAGDLTAAARHLEEVLTQVPGHEQSSLMLGMIRFRQGRTEEAETLLRPIAELGDSDPETLALVGIASLNAGDLETGEPLIEKALSLAPDNHELRLRYAGYLVKSGQYEKAITQADKVPDDSNLNEQARAMALIARGNLAARSDQPDKARTQFRQAVELAPDNRQALQALSELSKPEVMRNDMREILEKQPEATGPKLVLLESALLEDHRKSAEELTAALLERTDEHTPAPAEPLVAALYTTVVARLRQTGEPERAAIVLERARVLFPDSAAPYIVEARYFEQQGKYKQAAELYQLAYEKEPGAEIANGYARSLRRSGREDDALTFLESVIERFPADPQLRLGTALLQQSLGKKEDAISNYETLLASRPDNTVALNNLAWLYHETGDDRAMSLARRAYELSPQSAAVADTYGWIMLKAGNHQDSVAILEKAHELQPDSEEIAQHLAEAYRTIGKRSEAQQLLGKFGSQG